MQTWTSEDAGVEICKNCGTQYSVTITRFPCRDHDTFNCTVCGDLLKEWNSTNSLSFSLISK